MTESLSPEGAVFIGSGTLARNWISTKTSFDRLAKFRIFEMRLHATHDEILQRGGTVAQEKTRFLAAIESCQDRGSECLDLCILASALSSVSRISTMLAEFSGGCFEAHPFNACVNKCRRIRRVCNPGNSRG